jgi:hypothetical protein
MTNSIFGAHALSLVLGVIATSLAVQFVLRPAIIDSFRQRIFGIRRDALFLVAEGIVDAHDREYIATDLYLNGLLRFAERFTFSRLIVGMWIYRHHLPEAETMFQMPVSSDPEVSKRLWRIRVRATERLLWHIFETSPLAWVLVAVRLPSIVLREHIKKTRRAILWALGSLMPQTRIEREVTVMASDDEDPCLAVA